MEREKPNFDILGRIDRERLARGWSEYTLAENSGLTQSTLSTWRRRNLQPNVTSIEKICHGLGITLSQFFEEDTAVYHLTEEQKSLLTIWDRLSPSQTNRYFGFNSGHFCLNKANLQKRGCRRPLRHLASSSLDKDFRTFFSASRCSGVMRFNNFKNSCCSSFVNSLWGSSFTHFSFCITTLPF